MDTEGRETPYLLAAAAVLVVVVGIGVFAMLTWVNASGSEDAAPPTEGASQVEAAETPDAPTTPGPAGATRMQRCVSAAQALREPLEIARPAMDQWETHVDAMNQLVVGEITLQQASDFWNRTRVGAQRHVDLFDDAVDALRRQGVDCPSPHFLAPAQPALRPCAQQVEAETRVLEAAETSIDMWAEHVEDMDMLKLGTLSPEDATAMWLSMWQRGDQELQAYRSAVRDAQAYDECPAAAASG